MKIRKNSKGITLVALVVTIIVLLILSGITITVLLGDSGVIKKAQDAANKTNVAIEEELQGIDNLSNKMNSILEGSDSEEIEDVLEELEIGSTVTYNPSGTYNWQAKYCSSSKTQTTDDVLLNSAEGQDFNISSWKVLSIDKNTGTVDLIPSTPTTGTVYLGEAQGYNNAVKLLNDACSNLYGNGSKGITARSINIEDIEKYMTEEALEEAYKYPNPVSNTVYGNQVSNIYTDSKNYPVMYAKEKLSVINGSKSETGLSLSEQNEFIERSDGTSETSDIGLITTATSIQPYQTHWQEDEVSTTIFKNYTKKDNSIGNYYNLIIPDGANQYYWVASRCVTAYSYSCDFAIRIVYEGRLTGSRMYRSSGTPYSDTFSLFPVLTLNANSIEGNVSSGFSIK